MICNPFLFYLSIIILAMIYKYFLKKGGIILKMDGIIPKKAGIREKESRWAPLVSAIGTTGAIFIVIDIWVRLIQQEAGKISPLSGGE